MQRVMLFRGVSGIRKHTLVVNLSGSLQAVKENLGFALSALKYGIAILAGEAAECAHPGLG